MAAPRMQGNKRRYHKKYLFKVEIDGLAIAHFSTMSGLKKEVSVVEQHEAGVANVANKSPGKVKYGNVTLTAGVTDNTELYDWMEQVIDATSNTGDITDEYEKTVNIVQLNRDGSESARWKLYQAWPVSHEVGEWDASSDENLVETVELTYIRHELVPKA